MGVECFNPAVAKGRGICLFSVVYQRLVRYPLYVYHESANILSMHVRYPSYNFACTLGAW